MSEAREQSGARAPWIALGAAALGSAPVLMGWLALAGAHVALAARGPARVAEMMQRLEQRLAEQNGRFGFADEAMLVASGGFESLDDETHRTWRASAT